MTTLTTPEPSLPPPWWRFPIVWFALAGPALVVVACFATMAIAYRHADIVLVEAGPTATRDGGRAGPTAPALQARNHAATPPARP
ncbi:MAG TPA: nitrogen fixation protein FixH [Caldimonas sp.]|nr:nitrogen fixation protein FixH [Caldimonas sp.]